MIILILILYIFVILIFIKNVEIISFLILLINIDLIFWYIINPNNNQSEPNNNADALINELKSNGIYDIDVIDDLIQKAIYMKE